MPTSELGTLLDLAAKGKSQPMGSVSFTPPLIVPMDPDFAKIRRVVADKIAASEASATPSASASASTPGTTPPASGSPSGSTSATAKPKSTSKTQTDNLDSVCKVSS